jgi:urease accessory protein
MQAYSVTGLMVVSNANNEMLNMAREAEPVKSGLVSATLIGDLLICRCLGDQGIEVREFFTRIWEAIRPEWVGRKAVQPRIWNT